MHKTAESWSLSAASPSKAASPMPIHSQASLLSKHKGEDDLFWGPTEQSAQESKQVDFPQLTSPKSWGTKTTPGKANTSSLLNRQKPVMGMDRLLSASPVVPQTLHKGKKDTVIAHTEANDFRDWCRSECLRLLGSEHTSILEFCLKLPRLETETLLSENLRSIDLDHKFIDKFLNYKDLLPAEVVEIAFENSGIKEYKNNGYGKREGRKRGRKGRR